MDPAFESRPSTIMHSLASSHRVYVDNWTPLQIEVEMDYTIGQVEPVDIQSVESQLSKACQSQLQELLGNKNRISVCGSSIDEETTHIGLNYDLTLKTGIQTKCETSVNILDISARIPCRCTAYPSAFDLGGDYGSSTRVETKVYVAVQDHVDDSGLPRDLTDRTILVDGIPEAYAEKINKHLKGISSCRSLFDHSDKMDMKEGLLYDKPVLKIEGKSNAVLLKYRVAAADRNNLLETVGRVFWENFVIKCCTQCLQAFCWGGAISASIYGSVTKKRLRKFREPTNASDAYDAYQSHPRYPGGDFIPPVFLAPLVSLMLLMLLLATFPVSPFFAEHSFVLVTVSCILVFLAGPMTLIFPLAALA